MGLTGALQVGRTGLLTSQVAIQTAGNNLANISTEGYHRQRVNQIALPGQQIQHGMFLGTGVGLQSIQRIVDEALEGRLRTAISNESGSQVRQDLLRQIEAIEGEFSDIDLSSKLGAFFNAWSELANNPQDLSLRTLVLQEAATLSGFITDLRAGFTDLRAQADFAAGTEAKQADALLGKIAELNHRIALAEGGSGGAGALRDQRDQALAELSKYLDVSVYEQTSGAVDVYVGSIPVVLGTTSRGVELQTRVVDGDLQVSLHVKADGSRLDTSTGSLGAIVDFRLNDLQNAIDTLDTFAGQLIFQVNKLHASGQGLKGYTSLTQTTQVLDATAALNDLDATGLDFAATHGSFTLNVTQKSTGARSATTIHIDLDGLGGNDTTLADLAAAIDAVADVSAAVGPDGRLTITSDAGDFEFSFSDDTSGVLAALGFNTFFTGGSAADIGVNQMMIDDPARLAATSDHEAGGNGNALALAGLRTTGVAELDGFSLTAYWNRHVEDYAIRLSAAQQNAAADGVIRESLKAQQQSISGVNADEETINLIQAQRSFQASARFVSVVDELLQTLLNMV